jgi:hypothetical protein
LPVPVLAIDPQVVIRTPTVLILPIAAVPQVPTVLPIVPQVMTAPPAVLILRVVSVPPISAILSVVATVLTVTLRLQVLPPVLPLVLPPVLPVGIFCRVAGALIGSRSRLSRCIARSARALCVRKRHCRCERRANGHR